MERRQYSGRELTEADLLFGHGSRLWVFARKQNVNAAWQRLWLDPDRWTSNVIEGLLPFEFNLRIGAEERKQKVQVVRA